MKKLVSFIVTFVRNMPRYARVLLLTSFALQIGSYYITMFFTVGEPRVLTSRLDEMIPMVPVFIWVYLLAFPFWVWGLARAYNDSRELCVRTFTADALSKLVCVVVFILYPCTMVRPEIDTIHGVGAWAVKIIYALDGGKNPMNLLPSMHCYLSVMVCIPMFSKWAAKPTGARLKVFFCVFALLICASTLLVKQHVMIDLVTGVALAPVCWWAALLIWKAIDAKNGTKLPEGGN